MKRAPAPTSRVVRLARVLCLPQAHLWGMKREPIRTPFLAKAKEADYQESLALFKLILRFMNDNNLSNAREKALGDYIVNKVTAPGCRRQMAVPSVGSAGLAARRGPPSLHGTHQTS